MFFLVNHNTRKVMASQKLGSLATMYNEENGIDPSLFSDHVKAMRAHLKEGERDYTISQFMRVAEQETWLLPRAAAAVDHVHEQDRPNVAVGVGF